MGEAKRRRDQLLARSRAEALVGDDDTTPKETPAEMARPALGDLRKAHMPSASAHVEARVRASIRATFGDKVKAHRNYRTHEMPEVGVLTPDLVWSMVVAEIQRLDVLDADKRALRAAWRKQKYAWFGGITLEEWNVKLGGESHTMGGSYYGED